MPKIAAWKWIGLVCLLAGYVGIIFGDEVFGFLRGQPVTGDVLSINQLLLLTILTSAYVTTTFRLTFIRTMVASSLVLAFVLALLQLYAMSLDIPWGKSMDAPASQTLVLWLIVFVIPHFVVWLLTGLVVWMVRLMVTKRGGVDPASLKEDRQ